MAWAGDGRGRSPGSWGVPGQRHRCRWWRGAAHTSVSGPHLAAFTGADHQVGLRRDREQCGGVEILDPHLPPDCFAHERSQALGTDSSTKLEATFHKWDPNDPGGLRKRCAVVVAGAAGRAWSRQARPAPELEGTPTRQPHSGEGETSPGLRMRRDCSSILVVISSILSESIRPRLLTSSSSSGATVSSRTSAVVIRGGM